MYSTEQAKFKDDQVKQYKLEQESEFRFEVEWGEKVTVQLLAGKAEIFGAELGSSATYEFFGGSKMAVFTWHGCTLSVIGNLISGNVVRETPMTMYLNLHLALENMRSKSAINSSDPAPRVLIVGPPDSGKSTLARILTSYAVRKLRQPVYVDLDPHEGTLIIPTTIGAIAVDKIDVEQRNGLSSVSSPSLIYYFGHHAPSENMFMYNKIVEKLAGGVNQKMDTHPDVGLSGCIVDSPPWVDDIDYAMVQRHIDQFKINCIIVIGLEKKLPEFESTFKSLKPGITLIPLPRSTGAVSRDKAFRKLMQTQRIREYFYGNQKFELSPYTSSVSFSEIVVRRIPEISPEDLKGEEKADKGKDSKEVNPEQLLKIDIGSVLLHSVLAVSNADLNIHATEKDEKILSETNLAGFVYV